MDTVVTLDVQLEDQLTIPAAWQVVDELHFASQAGDGLHQLAFNCVQPLSRVNLVQKHEKLLAWLRRL